MLLTKRKIMEIYNVLNLLKNSKEIKPKSFIYKTMKNRNILESEIKLLEEIKPQLSDEYRQKYSQILLEHCDKDLEGKPMTHNNSGLIKDIIFSPSNELIVEEKIKQLNLLIPQEKIEAEIAEFEKILDEEIDIEIYKINLEDLYDGMNEEHLDLISDIIE